MRCYQVYLVCVWINLLAKCFDFFVRNSNIMPFPLMLSVWNIIFGLVRSFVGWFVQGERCNIVFTIVRKQTSSTKHTQDTYMVLHADGKESCIAAYYVCIFHSAGFTVETKFQCHNTFAYRHNRFWYEMYNGVNKNEVKNGHKTAVCRKSVKRRMNKWMNRWMDGWDSVDEWLSFRE